MSFNGLNNGRDEMAVKKNKTKNEGSINNIIIKKLKYSCTYIK
jgi:hypothetical protein